MGPTLPRVTVGIPVRNGERHLAATVESLLGQTMGDLELLISDNASDDGTEELCRRFAAEDARVHYVRQPRNLGANENYNELVRRARGELFKWAAHDDVCLPTYLSACVAALDAAPDAVLAHSCTVLVDDDGVLLPASGGSFVQADGSLLPRPDAPISERGLSSPHVPERFEGVLLRTAWVFEIFGVVRTAALRSTGLQESFYGTDKVVVAELALRGRFCGVDDALFHRRCHPGTSTNLGPVARSRWSDPDAPLVPPSIQMLSGYHRALRRAPLSADDRRGCYRVLARKAAEAHKRRLAIDLLAVLRARAAEDIAATVHRSRAG